MPKIKVNRIYACWVYVSDIQKSIDFYQRIGFSIKCIDNDWVEFDLGETVFALLKRPVEKGNVIPQKTRIMFEVDDGKLLTFEDPDGHWLELYQQ